MKKTGKIFEKKCNKPTFNFEKSYLKALLEDTYACVHLVKCVHHIALHPFHLTELSNSIKEILYQGIAKYNAKLHGILLGYQNIKILGAEVPINYDSCFLHMNIDVEFYLFKPEVDSVLKGIVNKKSDDHVGCLVHQIFNVSLPKPADVEEWLGDVVEIGEEIQFRITFTQFDSRLPYIRAEFVSIVSEDSGISTSEESIKKKKKKKSQPDEQTDTPKVSKKARKRKLSESINEAHTSKKINTSTDSTDEEIVKSKKPKKHKKHNSEDEDVDSSTSTDSSDKEIVKSKKPKKHKKDNSEDEDVDSSTSTDSSDKEIVKSKKPKKHKKHNEDEDVDSLEIKKGNKTNDTSDENVVKSKKNKKQKSENEDLIELKNKYKDKLSDLAKNVNDEVITTLVNDLHLSSKKSKKDKYKNKKTSKHKRNEAGGDELDISLPDLKLDALFDEDVNTSKMKSRKYRDSTSHDISWNEKSFELPPDSDLETIFGSNSKKKKSRKRECSISDNEHLPSSKRRKRNLSETEILLSAEKKKKSKHNTSQ